MAIIATVVLMLVLILNVSIPLFRTPTIETVHSFSPTSDDAANTVAIGVDDYRELTYLILSNQTVVFFDPRTGQEIGRQDLPAPDSAPNATMLSAESGSRHRFSLLWSTGHVSTLSVRMNPVFDDAGARTMEYRVIPGHTFEPAEESSVIRTHVAFGEGDKISLAVQTDAHSIEVTQVTTTENFLGEVETQTSTARIESDLDGAITAITLDGAGRNLYVGTDAGFIGWWDVLRTPEPVLVDKLRMQDSETAVTAIQFVFGDISIAVGAEDGALNTYFPTSLEDGSRTNLQKIHTLIESGDPIASILPSSRDKSLLVRTANGDLRSVHMTSERQLGRVPNANATANFALSTRGDTIVTLDDARVLTLWDYHKPHPEVSLKTLFSKVWYEKYDSPEYVWQSSASTDDYEPKFSLMPLIFGSFKGTVYAMIFAVPLALFGALYTNQFLSPRVRSTVKPLVEIMASIPSVVIGFLVALWLAPLVESYIVTFLISLVIIPLTIIPFLILAKISEGGWIYRRIELGYEFLLAAPVIILGCYISYMLSPSIESMLFEGDFKLWMYESLNTRYDQRNAIIISFGLGFVSIPIIFTISEDALSNLPQSLRAASLALGASRWQTAWRVVLPSASPGIFAAVIIGFGRVIGETMIVLMATGNTPIMDWSPFNGMRTLSANIAVEIPEAPIDGTLYRILFLSAALLFLLTFTLNTVAELIRQRLRKKYGQFQ